MTIADLLAPDGVLPDLRPTNRRGVFAALAAAAADQFGVDAATVADRLAERERLGTTAFGGGIALPHARIGGIDRVRGLFVRVPGGVDHAAIDGLPVDLVFMLLSPEDGGGEHLRALAAVSRRLRDRPRVERLRGTGSPHALYAILTGGTAGDAG